MASRKRPASRWSASHCRAACDSVKRPISTMKIGINGTTTARITPRRGHRPRGCAVRRRAGPPRPARGPGRYGPHPRLEGVDRRGGEGATRAGPRSARWSGRSRARWSSTPVGAPRVRVAISAGWTPIVPPPAAAIRARGPPPPARHERPGGGAVAVDEAGEQAADRLGLHQHREQPRHRHDHADRQVDAQRGDSPSIRGRGARRARFGRPALVTPRSCRVRLAVPGTWTGRDVVAADALAEDPVGPGLVGQHDRRHDRGHPGHDLERVGGGAGVGRR